MSQRSGPLAPGIAFITGGARGLGNAVAVSFAKEGAKGVVLVDIQNDETFAQGKKNVEAFGTKCLTIHADVTKESEIEAAIQQTVDTFGRIDYAANFAGVFGVGTFVSDMDVADWQKTQDVNSTGILISTKHEMRQMMKQDSIADIEPGRVQQRGSIINCASINSLQAMIGTAAYTASKHACHGISKAAALEGREHGVRVNVVSPGFLSTELVKGIEQSEEGKAVWDGCMKRQGRTAMVEEVGDVVVLLSTPRMSLVNGQNLFIDGGFTINEAAF